MVMYGTLFLEEKVHPAKPKKRTRSEPQTKWQVAKA